MNLVSIKRGPDLQWGRREDARGTHPVSFGKPCAGSFQALSFSPIKNVFKNEHAFLSK